MARVRIAGLAVATCAVAMAPVRPAVAQTIVAGPTTTQIATAVGDRITVPIAVDMTGASGIALGSYELAFRWDPSVLKFVSSASGDFASAVFNADSTSDGVVRVAAANAAGATGMVTLGSVTLEVLATDASSGLTVTFSELTAASTFQDLLPFLTITSLTFCPGLYLGDLDGNNAIQALDAQIVLMHSVGLAVSDTSAGDVDGDAAVDPRDALIILSYVVGLDVSQFLVAQFAGGACPLGIPASVAIDPQTLTLATGDVLTANAEVRDSTGALLGGLNLAWSSSDASVATVDSTGMITAVGLGTADVMAAAAPGVTDQATVTVGERHRWVVDPAVAQGQPTEVGSPTYPFSTIAQAIDSAAADDTIQIAVATYLEPMTTTKRLVFEGDSGASGMPVISTPDEPAGQLTVTGRQVLKWLEIAESQRGLVIRADTVVLQSVRFRSIRGGALEIRNAAAVGLSGISVDGAVGAGILVDSAGLVGIVGSRVEGVGQALDSIVSNVHAVGVFVRADTVAIDSSEVRGIDGPGIGVTGAQYALVRRSTISDVGGEGIAVDTSVVVLSVADSTTIKRVSDGIAAWGADTVLVANTVIDSVGRGIWVIDFSRVEVADVAVSHASDVGVLVAPRWDATGTSTATWLATARMGSSGGGAAVAVDVRRSTFKEIGMAMWLAADTSTVDSVTVEGGVGWGVYLERAGVAQVLRSQFLNMKMGGGVISASDTSKAPGYVVVANSVVRDAFADAFHLYADSILVQDDTVQNLVAGSGLTHAPDGEAQRHAAWVKVRGGRVSNTAWDGIYVDSAGYVEIVDLEIDGTSRNRAGSTVYAGAYLTTNDSVRVDSSNIHDNYAEGLYVWDSQVFAARENTLARSHFSTTELGGLTGRSAIHLEAVDSALVRASQFVDNTAAGVYFDYFSGDGVATVDSSSFRGRYWGVRAWGPDTLTGKVVVRNNTFTGALADTLYTRQIGMGPVRTLIVEDNIIDSAFGQGIAVSPGDTITVRNNVLTNIQGWAGIHSARGALALFENNSITCADSNSASGIEYHAGGGSILNNTVSKCLVGGYSHNGLSWAGQVFDLTVRGNTFTADGAVVPPALGYQLQGGLYRAQVVGNTVMGGEYSYGGIGVLGSTTYGSIPIARVDSNAVQTGAGRGLRLWRIDTLRVDSNTVNALDTLGAGYEAAISLRNIFTSAMVTRNSITGNSVPGVYVTGSATSVTIDTNLIADNPGAGIMLLSPASGTLNSIRRNGYGIVDSTGTGSVFQANNLEGNGFGVLNLGLTALDATNSWWGDMLGPRCAVGCDLFSIGDSVSANVVFSPFATDSVIGAPVGAPPALAVMAGRQARLRRPSRVAGGAMGPELEGGLLPVREMAGGGGAAGTAAAARAATRSDVRALKLEAIRRRLREQRPPVPERRQ